MGSIIPIAEKKRLSHSCYRGTRELEELMSGFLNCHYDLASKQQKSVFKRLLLMEDDQLWDWIYHFSGDAKLTMVTVEDRVKKAIQNYEASEADNSGFISLSGIEPESKA